MLKAFISFLLALSLLGALTACDGAPRGPRYSNVRPYSEGLAPVQAKNGKWGYINEQQRMVIQPQFDDAQEFKNGKAPACLNGKCGFINKQGKWL
ncbi:MAG: WG repeat-containing protein [Zoogloeaceae bacterium]|nr:WG repeat-containing protein [Zoogloeaceae bacterium]